MISDDCGLAIKKRKTGEIRNIPTVNSSPTTVRSNDVTYVSSIDTIIRTLSKVFKHIELVINVGQLKKVLWKEIEETCSTLMTIDDFAKIYFLVPSLYHFEFVNSDSDKNFNNFYIQQNNVIFENSQIDQSQKNTNQSYLVISEKRKVYFQEAVTILSKNISDIDKLHNINRDIFFDLFKSAIPAMKSSIATTNEENGKIIEEDIVSSKVSTSSIFSNNLILASNAAISSLQGVSSDGPCNLTLQGLRELAIERGLNRQKRLDEMRKEKMHKKSLIRINNLLSVADAIRSLYHTKNKTSYIIDDLIQSLSQTMPAINKNDIYHILFILVKQAPEYFILVPKDSVCPHDVLKINFHCHYTMTVRPKLKQFIDKQNKMNESTLKSVDKLM